MEFTPNVRVYHTVDIKWFLQTDRVNPVQNNPNYVCKRYCAFKCTVPCKALRKFS